MRPHVIFAVLKRNLMSYFSGVLGYLFIVVFVVAAAWSAFNAQFFTNNLANLDQLTASFPYLLLFIIPAVTMTAWADEKRQGTDELLFTLPASDFDILLGKFLSLVVVYTIALAFSMTQLGVLGYYADPDWGLLATTYFGYWLAGSALIAAGMFASVLTSSITVAFVLGSIICAVPVFVGTIGENMPRRVSQGRIEVGESFRDTLSSFCHELSLAERLREFAMGVVPLSGLVYFVSLIAFFLYLNLVFVGRRHWVKQTEGMSMAGHSGTRIVCLGITLVACNLLISKASEAVGMRFDMTAERLYTLSRTTTDLMGKIDKDAPITIQAFISPQVPREFVGHQTRLKGLLRQYDRMGGSAIEVRYVDVQPFSEEADEARHFGIEPNRSQTDRDGRIQVEDVFMGAVVSSPNDQVVIPFFEQGSSIEYELTRSIRTVAKKERLTVGILRTDAKVNGGFDMATFRSSPEWRVQQELKKQYIVKDVGADTKIEDKLDVLIAVLPSSLNKVQLDNLVEYTKAGHAVLILDDPLPLIDPRNSPSQPKPRQGGGMFGNQMPPEERAYKGTNEPLMKALGLIWKNNSIVWDNTKPHPQFADVLQPEYVFVTPQNGNPRAISSQSDVTSSLQEILTLFAGEIHQDDRSKLKFQALLETGGNSGINKWEDMLSPGMFGGMEFKQDASHNPDEKAHVLAAHVTGENDGSKVNAIFVADVDIISDALFNVVQNEMHGLRLDNVKFILNCVDVLAGDNSYVDLRKRRPQHRALTEIQRIKDEFGKLTQKERDEAEKSAKEAVEKLKTKLTTEVEKIEKDANLSPLEKAQRMEMARQRVQRELDVEEANIQRKKQEKLDQLKAREQRQNRYTEGNIRFLAVLFPPIPAILLAIILLSMRRAAEVRDIEEIRRLTNNR